MNRKWIVAIATMFSFTPWSPASQLPTTKGDRSTS